MRSISSDCRAEAVWVTNRQPEPMKQAEVGSYPIGGQGYHQEAATQYGNVQPPMEGHALPMSPPPVAKVQQYYAPPAGLPPSATAVIAHSKNAAADTV